jgi:hypothetical protein
MPIKSSPAPLAISEIVTEFGDSAGGSDSLSEYYKGGANVDDVSSNSNVPASGAIDIGDFYGAGNVVSVAASAGTNIDVAPLFGSPDTFTNAVSKVLTIASPIQIVGNNVALTVPSTMAGTLDIQNAGNIIGSRGGGGNAGSNGGNATGGAGSAGGAAISIQKAGVTINNSGTISGGGGGGGGGGLGAPTASTNTTNFGGTNYSGGANSGRGWNQNWGGNGAAQSPGAFYDGVVYGPAGGPNNTQLSQSSPPGSGTINRGSPLNDPQGLPGQPGASHTKRFNIGSGSFTTASTSPGGNGGNGGNGYGFDSSSVVNAQSGGSASGNGAAGGAGGNAGAAGTAGSNSPANNGGAGGAGGNSVTSPGSVNYSVSNSGTINGTQG